MLSALKYFIIFPFLFILAANCTDQENKIQVSRTTPPNVRFHIDSAKFHDVIFRLDTLFEKLNKANQINGNVLIAKNGEVIYQKCFGWADKENLVCLSDTHMFQLASVSKVFTATAVLKLYELGKIDLNEKVKNILPEFPYSEVTIKHLLTHRSGLPNYTYFCSEFLKNDTTTLSNQNVLDVMSKHKPNLYFNAGKRFNYSNTNYAILALVIEKISGNTYSDFLYKEIFNPIGMKNTQVRPIQDEFGKYLTKGYTASFKPVFNDRFDGVVGDKGIYSTPYDLFLFSEALYQNKILKSESQQLAYHPYSPERKSSNYGLGWRMKNMNTPQKEVFHNGWWHGYRTSFHRRLNDSLTVIVLSNRLNSSVYATWKIYQAIDGPHALEIKGDNEDE